MQSLYSSFRKRLQTGFDKKLLTDLISIHGTINNINTKIQFHYFVFTLRFFLHTKRSFLKYAHSFNCLSIRKQQYSGTQVDMNWWISFSTQWLSALGPSARHMSRYWYISKYKINKIIIVWWKKSNIHFPLIYMFSRGFWYFHTTHIATPLAII